MISSRNYIILYDYYCNFINLSLIIVKYTNPYNHPNNTTILYDNKCNKYNDTLDENQVPNIVVLNNNVAYVPPIIGSAILK